MKFIKNGSIDVPGARAIHNHLLEFGLHPAEGRVIVGTQIAQARNADSPCDHCTALYALALTEGSRTLA